MLSTAVTCRPKRKRRRWSPSYYYILSSVALAEDFLYFRLPRNGPVLSLLLLLLLALSPPKKKVVCVCVLYHSTRTTWRMLLKLFGSLQTFLAKKKKEQQRLSHTHAYTMYCWPFLASNVKAISYYFFYFSSYHQKLWGKQKRMSMTITILFPLIAMRYLW